MKLLSSLLFLVYIGATPVLAQMYQWTDEQGVKHYTDNLGTVPSAYLSRAGELVLSTPKPGGATGAEAAPQWSLVHAAALASPSDAERMRLLQHQIRELKQQIDTVEQERQTYLSRINALRPIRMNPKFGRRRRRSAVWGQDLIRAQQQLDSLYAELQSAEAELSELEKVQRPAPPVARRPYEVVVDQRGHTALYYQRRLHNLRTRLHSSQEQRQAIQEELGSKMQTQHERRAFGRLGRQIVYQSRALRDIERDIRDMEAAVHALQEEAARAGTPTAWLQ